MTGRGPGTRLSDLLHRLSRLGPAGRSLRIRLTGAVTVLSALGITGVSAATFLAARAVLRDQVTSRIGAVAEIKVGELNRWIEERRSDVAFAAELPELGRLTAALLDQPDAAGRVAAVEARIRRFAETGARFHEVFVVRADDGFVLISSDSARRGVYELPSTYREGGQERVTVQEVYVSPEDGTPTVTVAAPIPDPTGRTLAVLAAHLDLTRLGSLIEARSGLGSGAEVYLVNEVGDFLSAARARQEPYRRGARSAGIDRALAGESGVGAYPNYAGESVLGAYRWLPERRMALLVEIPQAVAFAPARALALATLAAGVLGILGLALALRILARQVSAPVESLSAAARRVAAGDFDVRVAGYGQDELGQLARSFNIMTARLDAVYTELEDQVAQTTRAHAEAEGSRLLLESLIDNSSGLIAVSDAQGRVYLSNRRFREIAGAEDGPIEAPLDRLLPDEAARSWRDARREALEQARPVETHFTVPAEDGDLHFVAVVFPIRTHGRAEVGMIALDRSEAERAESERRSLEQQLLHAQKLESLGLLAGGVAHDFNNLLQVILGNAALAELGVHDGETRNHLEQVQAAAAKASDLTAQLLAYAGRRSLRNERVEVNRVIAGLGELLQGSVPEAARLAVRLGEPGPVLDADPAQVVQVVMNLVTNAADALVDGIGTILVTTDLVELGSERAEDEPGAEELDDGPYARIVVEDDGAGMDASTRDRIFDPFFSTKASGRGLGLAAVMGVAKGGRGHVAVSTAVGEGTRVEVYLPASAAEGARGGAEPVGEAPDRAREPEGALFGRTILVADDERGIRRFLTRALEKRGARVIEAVDGLQAVDRFREHPHRLDAAVLDLTMPGLIGTEVLREIRKDQPDLPTVLMSGYDAADTADSVAALEGVTFLQKPFEIRDLVERLLSQLT